MKRDLQEVLARQAAWQRARSARTWEEKLRTALIMRQALLALRKAPPSPREAAPPVRE